MTQERDNTPNKGAARDGERQAEELHEHERVDALMPWIQRGQLQDEDCALVDERLARSPAFQAKLAQESDLATALEEIAAEETAESEKGADAAWAKFQTRLATPEAAPPKAHTSVRPRASTPLRTSPWRRFRLPQTRVGWLAATQTAALAALAFVFVPGQISQSGQEYRTLSSDGAEAPLPAGNAVLMLDPATDQATVQALLSQAGARIVDGPMANGGYVIALDEERFEAGLATLRASDAVTLAEPLDSGSPQ